QPHEREPVGQVYGGHVRNSTAGRGSDLSTRDPAQEAGAAHTVTPTGLLPAGPGCIQNGRVVRGFGLTSAPRYISIPWRTCSDWRAWRCCAPGPATTTGRSS